MSVEASAAIDLSRLPGSDKEAEELANRWQSEDPFPNIDPALLNTADLFDYVATTGLIYPFRVDPADPTKALKPASCGIQLAGEVIYWDPEHRDPANGRPAKQKQQLGEETQVLTLPSNSIVYATLEPTFRLPDYIAARFNLNIFLVYRGLLVGTGPLVDPGFRGRLSLPLHNLTARPCNIQAGEIVIWMEFTKLSRNDRWKRKEATEIERSGVYVPFPEWKIARGSVGNYLETVHKDEPIISSIPDEIAIARQQAETASAEATRTRRNAKWFEVGAGFALTLGVIALLGFLWSVDRDLTHDADSAVRRANEIERVNNRILNEVKVLRAQVRASDAAAGP